MGKAAQGRLILLTTSLFIILLVGIIDTITGHEISFSIFYIAPIALASWYAGKQIGRTAAICASVVWLAADLQAGDVFSQQWIPYWNSSVRLVWFWVVASYLADTKAKLDRERQPNRIDPVTGAFNSWAFYHRAEMATNQCHVREMALTIAYIDCQLKDSPANRAWSSTKLVTRQGEELWLCSVVETILPRLHASDTLARIAGGNFGLVLPNTNSSAARLKLETLVAAVSEAMLNEQFPVQCTIAGVTYTQAPASLGEVVDKADDLLLSIKNAPHGTLKHETICLSDKIVTDGDFEKYDSITMNGNNLPADAMDLYNDSPRTGSTTQR